MKKILPHYLAEVKKIYGDEWNKVKIQEDGAPAHTAFVAQDFSRKELGRWMSAI